MTTAEEKDFILNQIKESKAIRLWHKSSVDFAEIYHKHQTELSYHEYTDLYQETIGGGRPASYVQLTPKGLTFINNGGYTAIEQKELREEERKRTEWRWRYRYEISTLCVSLVAIGFTAATYFFTPKNSDLEKLQQQIDSLKRTAPRAVENPPKILPIVTPPVSNTSVKKRH